MSEPESARERIKRLVKNTGIYTLGDAGVRMLLALLAPILTFILTPAEFGIWGLAGSVMLGFATLCNPALHGSVTRFYFDHRHEHEARRRFQGTVLSFLLLWSFGLCVFVTTIGDWLFARLFDNFAFWPYGAFAVWMTFIAGLGVVPKAIWQASERAKPIVGLSLLENSVFVFGSIGLLTLTHLGLIGLFVGRTASLAVAAVPLLIYSLRHVGLAWSWTDLRSALKFSLPLVPHLLAHWVLNMSDRIMIERYYGGLEPGAAIPDGDFGAGASESVGLQAVGIYELSCVFIGVVTMIAASMNKAWVPQFYQHHGHPEQRAYIARSITWFVLGVAAMSTASIVLSPTIIRMFQREYEFAASIAPILAFGGLFQGLYYVYVAVLFHNKVTWTIPVITVVSGGLNIALNLLWIPKYGLAGAAWATVIGYTALAIGVRWAARRYPMPDFELGRLTRIAAVLSAVTLAGLLLDARLPLIGEALAKLALLSLGAASLYLLGIFERRE